MASDNRDPVASKNKDRDKPAPASDNRDPVASEDEDREITRLTGELAAARIELEEMKSKLLFEQTEKARLAGELSAARIFFLDTTIAYSAQF